MDSIGDICAEAHEAGLAAARTYAKKTGAGRLDSKRFWEQCHWCALADAPAFQSFEDGAMSWLEPRGFGVP